MLTRLCTCILITRRDGVVMGFTDHDAPLTVAGQIYDPHGGFDASSIESKIGASVDSLDAAGYVSDDRITEDDIRDGRYDAATVAVSLVDWQALTVVRSFPPYEIADIEMTAPAITATVENAAALAWNREQGRVISGNCPYVLGDADCGVTVATVAATITATDGRTWIETAAGSPAVGVWRGGTITLGGQVWEIARVEGTRLTVYGALAGAEIGAAVTLKPGCDKSWAMCGDFLNRDRFGGFPHVPTQDAQIRVARQGDGTNKNGGSIFSS